MARLNDERVHAHHNGRSIVRKDRSGRWWLNGPGGRQPLTVQQAADLAAAWTPYHDAVITLGLPGGRRFDTLYRRATAT